MGSKWNDPVDLTDNEDEEVILRERKPWSPPEFAERNYGRVEDYEAEKVEPLPFVAEGAEIRHARLNTPFDVRKNALKRAKDLAASATRAIEQSVEWFGIDDAEAAASYTQLVQLVTDYEDRVAKRYDGARSS